MIPSTALKLYAQVQSGDNAVPALLRATAILQKHGAAQAADDLLDRLVEDEPLRAPEILAARARIYADSGELPRALEVLQQGREEYPDSVDLRYAMASTYEEMGRIPAAVHELTELMNARPDDPAAMNALGYTLADHSRDLTRARKLIERANAEAPRNAAILDSLGWVLVPARPYGGSGALLAGSLSRMIAAATSRRISARCCGSSANAPMPNTSGPRPPPSMATIICSRPRGNACTARRSHCIRRSYRPL